MIAAYSELWGTFLAWDLRAREEGGTLLLQAQLLDALQGAGEPDERSLKVARNQLDLARGAWEQLRHTGDVVRAQDARALIDVAQQRVARLEAALSRRGHGGRCPRCGFENPPDVRFCTQCGTELVADRVREERWLCPTCQRSNRPGDRFCTQCGTPRR
jgi:predicted Zn-ribbon and HTH transcriptional regulator